MKTYIPLILLLWLAACSSPAAQNAKTQNASTKSDTPKNDSDPEVDTSLNWVYDDTTANYSRYDTTFPPYGLDKVKAHIAKLKFVEDPDGGDQGTTAVDKKTYASLSFNEKFTYHLIHAESYSQNCDIPPQHPKTAERIYATLPDFFNEESWSERQVAFFKDNRDSVTALLKSLIEKSPSVGGNIKEAIVEMNGTELIPTLISWYNKEKKDHFILTVLLLLMKNNNYPEFINSTGYKKLYREPKTEADYKVAFYLTYNKANEDLIIQRATNFYNGLQAK
jgi:hypothetical protein